MGRISRFSRFTEARGRVLAAHAAMAAAERKCLRATADEALAVAQEVGLGDGVLMVFHAVPRPDAVWELDDLDCSRDDAVLVAVDLTDLDGQRLRLTRGGAAELPPGGTPPSRDGQASPAADGDAWERAVLAWVDLHRALLCWTGRYLAPSLVIAPAVGDVGSVEPFYCPDRGQDFEVVTSLRVAPEEEPPDELEAALVNVLDEPAGVTPDQVEFELRVWLEVAGLGLPGYPAHAPGGCEPSAEER